jgi:hypothetical protein
VRALYDIIAPNHTIEWDLQYRIVQSTVARVFLVVLHFKLADPSSNITRAGPQFSKLNSNLIDSLLRVRHVIAALTNEDAPFYGIELLAQSLSSLSVEKISLLRI